MAFIMTQSIFFNLHLFYLVIKTECSFHLQFILGISQIQRYSIQIVSVMRIKATSFLVHIFHLVLVREIALVRTHVRLLSLKTIFNQLPPFSGSRFALMEIKAVFYNLLLNFSFEPNERTVIPVKLQKTPFTMRPENGMHLALKPRKI